MSESDFKSADSKSPKNNNDPKSDPKSKVDPKSDPKNKVDPKSDHKLDKLSKNESNYQSVALSNQN